MQSSESDLERGLRSGGRRHHGSSSTASPREPPSSSRRGSDTDGSERIRRSRNPGTAPASKQSVKAFTKAESFPFWGSFRRFHSDLNEAASSGKKLNSLSGMERRNSVPVAVSQTNRRSTIGKVFTGMLPLGPFIGQEDEDDDLWFTAAEDFAPPMTILQQSESCASYFVKAVVCKKNFVMHIYQKERLTAAEEKRVRRLIDFMQWLRHPHVVKCLGVWETEAAFFVVEEYCHRGNLLQQLVINKKSFTELYVVEKILKPLLDALIYLHDHSIVHRGVVPENVVFGKGNVLRLSGFLSAIEYTRSRPCSRLGPLDYAAPEMLEMPEEQEEVEDWDEEELPEYDEKVDVWQLGVLTYELLSGTCPFEMGDALQTAHLVMSADVHSFPPEFSPGAISFIKGALNKAPHSRPTMLELSEHPWLQSFAKKKSSKANDKRLAFILNKLRKMTHVVTAFENWRQQVLSKLMKKRERVAPADPEEEVETGVASQSLAGHDVAHEPVIPFRNVMDSTMEIPSILNMDIESANS